jgi:tetratricopeptide (TPR) repeat protein
MTRLLIPPLRATVLVLALGLAAGCFNVDVPILREGDGPLADIVAAPGNPHYHFYLGRTAMGRGEFEEALEHFNRAVALQSNFYEAHLGAGHARMEMKQYARARRAYERARECRDTPDVQLNLARAEMFDGRPIEAQARADAILETHPRPAQVWEVLGAVAYRRGDLNRARECWTESLALDQSNDALRALLDDLNQYLISYPPDEVDN